MAILMDELGGVGLAAPQVGINKRFFVMRQADNSVILVINPRITRNGGQLVGNSESCLSKPLFTKFVYRSRVITTTFQTPLGRSVELVFKGKYATIFQHELDHLNGVTIFDRPVPKPESTAPVLDQSDVALVATAVAVSLTQP